MADRLLPAYLAVGKNDAKRARACAHLKRHVDPSLVDFNLDELRNARDVEPATLVGSCRQMPFGEGPRVVIVHDADKLPAETTKAFLDYLESPNPDAVVLLDCPTLAKNTRLYKAVARLGAKAVIDCEPVKGFKLPPVVLAMAEGRGLRLGPGAADELVSRLGESEALIDSVLAGLAETHGPGAFLSREDIVANVRRVEDVKPWHVADAVCARDAGRALELLGDLGGTSVVAVLSITVARLEELLCFSCAGPAAAGVLGGPQWRFKNHARWARGFSEAELVHGIEDAAEVERAVKGAGRGALADADAAMRLWVVSLCVPGAPRVSELA